LKEFGEEWQSFILWQEILHNHQTSNGDIKNSTGRSTCCNYEWIISGTSYEPPLTNVFTMQWFLTLFSNCLPQPTVLRVWDLIFLEGNEVLLRTALAIWDGLAE
jgi:hypothetical protein